MAGVSQLIFPCTKVASAVSATGVVYVCPPPNEGRAIVWTFYILFSHTSSAGALQVETAPYRDFDGTWAAVGSAVTWSAIDKCHTVHASNLYQSLRVRVATTVADGTADVWAMAANQT